MPTPACTPWLALAAGAALGAATVAAIPARSFFVETAAVTDHAGRWACPMLDYIGTRPGSCPVCGMAMHPVTAGEITREQARRMGIQLATVESGPALVTVRAAGTAAYDHRFSRIVIPRVAGRIVRRHAATAGCCQVVEAGEPVVDLYSPEVFQAQAELQAALRLGDARLIDALGARFARWNLGPVAEAIRAGGEPVDTVTITAPYAGQVLLQDMEGANEALQVGREVMPDTPLLRLVDPDRLVVVVHAPETRAAFLREGQAVELDSDDGGRLDGLDARVSRVAAEIAPETRSVEVRIYLTGARDRLRPGALVSARIRGALGPDLRAADPGDPATWGRFPLVPADAVLSTGVRTVAWRVDGETAEGARRYAIAPLVLGPRIEGDDGRDRFVVRAGLAPGDRVAAQGAFLIDSQAQLAGSASLLMPAGAGTSRP